MSGQVASHTRSLPLFHGTTVIPSGRLPSERKTPVGSSRDGTCAAVRANFTYCFVVYLCIIILLYNILLQFFVLHIYLILLILYILYI